MEGPEAAYVQSDLYADVMTDPPIQENNEAPLEQDPENQALEYKSYTTLHPKSQEQQDKEAKIAATLGTQVSGKQVYVGNLTWWTNDEELSNAVQECGVTDLLSVKFFENRINGQSKGFALVEVASDTSHRLILDRLPNQTIHGQKPMATFVTKPNLTMFEQQARKDKGGSRDDDYKNYRDRDRDHRDRDYRDRDREDRHHHDRRDRNRPQFPPPMQPQFIAAPGFQPGAPVQLGPQIIDHNLGMQPQQIQFPPGTVPPGAIVVDAMGNVIQGGLPPINNVPGFAPGIPVSGAPPQFQPRPGVGAHINPAFMQPDGGGPVDPVTGVPLQTQGLSEEDMESMRRNQAVGSTAIQRAMSDANAGEFESGIETLVTAISLIKQSTTSKTEPAQVLIQSLQDCLHGLESQLVQRNPGHRPSSRYSPDGREGRDDRDRRRRRDRSRSRSRDNNRDRDRNRGERRDRRRSYSPIRGRSRSPRRR